MSDLGAVHEAYSSMSERYIALYADGTWRDQEENNDLLQRHLAGLDGPVLDLGCGPGHWTGHLHSLGVDVTGIDIVPTFLDYARATQDGPSFWLGSMTEVDLPAHSVAGILSWYSTIHLSPVELDQALGEFRRLLTPDGALVVGFFDSDDDVAAFDHAVTTAYRWPADTFAERLQHAGFTEVERLQQQVPNRPDRKYAAIAAHAT